MVGILAALSAKAQTKDPAEGGVGVGGFFEVSTERQIGQDDARFTFSGGRVTARGDVWGEGYADLGWETLDLNGFNASGALMVVVGGTLWCWTWDTPVAPVSAGIVGDYHMAEHAIQSQAGGVQTDVRHTRVSAQATVKAHFGSLTPYVRIGCLQSTMDPDNAGLFNGASTKDTVPAIQGGFEYAFDDEVDRFTIGVEANYFSGPGAAVRIAYWF